MKLPGAALEAETSIPDGEISDVSVVVLSHNRRGLLRRTLASVASQSVRCELIVVDNNSTDST